MTAGKAILPPVTKKIFGDMKMCYIFVPHNILEGSAQVCRISSAGYFYACTLLIIKYGVTPVWNCNRTTALKGVMQRVGNAVFFLLPIINHFFVMHNTKKGLFGNNSTMQPTQAGRNTASFNPKDFHSQKFYSSIEDFFCATDPSEYLKTNNDLLTVFLAEVQDEQKNTFPAHVQSIILNVIAQNQFITELSENWQRFKLFNNIKIK